MAVFLLIVLPSMTGYMAWEARAVEVTVLDIEGAPEGIVYITDPHVRASNIDHVREVIREVNRLNPSLVLIGGDFVTGEEEDFASQEVWNSLDAPAYAVLGNHDYRVGIDGPTGIERTLATRASAVVTADAYDVSALNDGSADTAFADNLTAALEENGVRVLRNDYVRTSVGNEEIVIVGVDDGWAGMADPPDVPATDAFTVYLVHEPRAGRTGTPTSSSPATPTAVSSSSRSSNSSTTSASSNLPASSTATGGRPPISPAGSAPRVLREWNSGSTASPRSSSSTRPGSNSGRSPDLTPQGWHAPARRSTAPP
ncbi:metallophosphoesterase [Methanoculleus sp. MH98A]|uniref:metallophosphoesterase n=1 Tax=Methanoculleus sp. MH98A TaxID=1495314 RepID=UPI001E2CEF84|nr:metallophosphoesterase [Methanoculleus sp. MH98A]